MEIKVNRSKDDLIKHIKNKATKKDLQCKFENGKFTIESVPGKSKETQTPVPVMFKGTIEDDNDSSIIKGRFSYGFYFSTLVIIAIVFIIARFSWSLYQKQTDNMILCGIVTVLLIIVCVVIQVKGKELKQKITDFLLNLDKKI